MKRENGRVLVDIDEEEFELLLLALGIATDAAARPDFRANFGFRDSLFRLANTINEGNPDWTPYKLPPETTA
jgi:hypothetical protein